MSFDRHSRTLLTPRDLPRFEGDSLFSRVARAVCGAACLPRKELFESWEVAERVRKKWPRGDVFDLACGHGFLAHALLLLEQPRDVEGDANESHGVSRALAFDAKLPPSAATLSGALTAAFPELQGRVELIEAPLAQARPQRGEVVVSAHACGALTDAVLRVAAHGLARVAVLPCCHDGDANDAAGLTGWLDEALAIDAARAVTLRDRGYHIETQLLPADITPKNRLLLGTPLLELYEATRYDAHLPSGTVSLRHGQHHAALDALLDPDAPEWAFLTTWNPGSRRHARDENERRQRELIRQVSGRYKQFHGVGAAEDESWSELSTLVLGIALEDARALGRAWGQVAILAGRRGEPARVVLCEEHREQR
ncbi:MAG: DUF3293 domain-containing protein [Deltaproteobacteria bacterium]|nr:DUF3293 domain-containing protein [Deltaproteobacteria bacterium]